MRGVIRRTWSAEKKGVLPAEESAWVPFALQPFIGGGSALIWLDQLFPEGGRAELARVFSIQKGEELGVHGSTGSSISEPSEPEPPGPVKADGSFHPRSTRWAVL